MKKLCLAVIPVVLCVCLVLTGCAETPNTIENTNYISQEEILACTCPNCCPKYECMRSLPSYRWSKSYTTYAEYRKNFSKVKLGREFSIVTINLDDMECSKKLYSIKCEEKHSSEVSPSKYAFEFLLSGPNVPDFHDEPLFSFTGESYVVADITESQLRTLKFNLIDDLTTTKIYLVTNENNQHVMKLQITCVSESDDYDSILYQIKEHLIIIR